MTITTFLKEHNSKIKTAKKLNVRDLDRLNDFETVAYVDDAKESYDVKVVINSRKNIVDTICDCEEGGVCKHIVALVLHLSENKTEKAVLKPRSKKQTETDTILNALDNDNLRIWISEILNTNKELAFLFKNQFGTKQVVFNSDYIKKTVKASLQSVIGKRRTIETNEVKKFVDALTISTKEVLEQLFFGPITKEKYSLIKILIDELANINANYYISSIKITRFIENIYDTLIKSLFTIKDIDVWKESVQLYFSYIFEKQFLLFELHQCEKIYEFSKTNENQQKAIVQIVAHNFELILEKSKISPLNLIQELESFIFKIFTENGLFEKYASKFKPRLYQNEYNINLLNALMEIEHFDSVEVYCNEIIERNYQEKYNVPYLQFLITIHKANNDNKKLAQLYSVYGKFIYDIEVYLFIKENLPLADFKKYRMSVFIHARNSYQSGDLKAFDFYFEIKKLDGKEEDLFEMLQNSANLSFVNKYKEIAIEIKESKFFTLLFRFGYEYRTNFEDIESIANYIFNKIEKSTIQFYLKQNSTYSYTRFYKKILELVN
ncbi:hypothetical protein [Flavobacterium sp. PL002]|uniref:hypothetical protein n=1 Tax=Flavobacterium sp. PL002 TaxID=1897058 RepID=UPI0017888AAF|nr:hypothetical protein [Flavobacterium sp. PL002]MBE0391977.1 hypothetical protein [Flavobacterium sp. PL002]